MTEKPAYEELKQKIKKLEKEAEKRKRTEEALLESEERYRSFIAHSSEGIYRVDMEPPVSVDLPREELIRTINRHAIVAEVNEALADMYGLKPEDMLGKRATDFAPNYGERASLILQNERYQVNAVETIDADKDGKPLFLMESYHGEVERSQLVRVWGVQRNITEHKQAEEALRESEARFRGLVESSSDWIWAVNSEGVYTYVSPKIEDILGYKPEEVIGKKPFDLMPPEEAERIGKIFMAFVARCEPIVALENVNQHKDGHLVILETNGVPILGIAGNVHSYQGVDRDITDRKLAEKILQKRTQDLNERVKELNCLYGISRIIEKGNVSLDEILKDIVTIIPPSWQYPEITCSRIILKGHEYKTQNFSETSWNQSSEIVVRGERVGMVEVYYLEEKPKIGKGPFFKEELNLLKAIAEQIGGIIERIQAEQEVKMLSGLLPICANCKKIKDDQGYWNQIEGYIERHSDALFTHGLCPECMDKLYGDEDWYKKIDGDK